MLLLLQRSSSAGICLFLASVRLRLSLYPLCYLGGRLAASCAAAAAVVAAAAAAAAAAGVSFCLSPLGSSEGPAAAAAAAAVSFLLLPLEAVSALLDNALCAAQHEKEEQQQTKQPSG